LNYFTVIGLYGVFWLAAAISGPVGMIGSLVLWDASYLSHISRSMDALLAAMLGWSGRNTVSNECGNEVVAGNPCRLCRVICWGLDLFLETDHCRKNASK
jgi:hypothetical protein